MIFDKKIKRGQVAIFIIVAVVIVGAVLIYFVFRENLQGDEIPEELLPVFDYYQSCIEYESRGGLQVAGSQGGYVDVPPYVPGSDYAPFSSHLNFFGAPIPYWYYVSANGLIREQVPAESEIEQQLENYIEDGLLRCDFELFYQQGFNVAIGELDVNVQIEDANVDVSVNADLQVSKGEVSARQSVHEINLDTKFGKFYNLARKIYSDEKEKAFLEEMAVDVLYLYTPVDGVEIQCGPKIWSTVNVMNELRDGLEKNFETLKFSGDYYELSDEKRKYFVLDTPVTESVNVMYSKNWPTKIEINGEGVDDDIMVAQAVGTQAGLATMGFCYVPYHFVYDVSFPVMIQIYDTNELFQFPVVVVLDKSYPRNGLESGFTEEPDFDLCEFPTENIEVNLYDINLRRVNANVSYECFNQRCNLGESRNGRLVGMAPACLNGYLNIRADGFAEKRQGMSTNSERKADVILDREREVNVSLTVGSSPLRGNAIISFLRDDGFAASAVLPGLEKIKLSEGSYDVKVYAYGNASVTIPASTKTECVDAPRSGVLGFLGGTKEKCFTISLPETKIENALIGGGNVRTYMLDSELEKGGLKLRVDPMPIPKSVDDLQKNFEAFETKRVDFEFYEFQE